MNFDLCDTFDAASMYRMVWLCDDCGEDLVFESQLPIGLEYYHALAQTARSLGWHAADTSHEDSVDYLMLCPQCARRRDASASEDGPSHPPEGVMIIAELAARPDELQALVAQVEDLRRRASE